MDIELGRLDMQLERLTILYVEKSDSHHIPTYTTSHFEYLRHSKILDTNLNGQSDHIDDRNLKNYLKHSERNCHWGINPQLSSARFLVIVKKLVQSSQKVKYAVTAVRGFY